MHLAGFVTEHLRYAIVALQTQLSPPTSVAQPMQRLGSNSAKLPQFQAAATSSGQIPLLAPPPLNNPGVTPRQLSGVPGGMWLIWLSCMLVPGTVPLQFYALAESLVKGGEVLVVHMHMAVQLLVDSLH